MGSQRQHNHSHDVCDNVNERHDIQISSIDELAQRRIYQSIEHGEFNIERERLAKVPASVYGLTTVVSLFRPNGTVGAWLCIRANCLRNACSPEYPTTR